MDTDGVQVGGRGTRSPRLQQVQHEAQGGDRSHPRPLRSLSALLAGFANRWLLWVECGDLG